MKSISKKIIGKIVCLVCAVGIIGTTLLLSGKEKEDAITVSKTYNDSDKPIIILDAGHGGMDGGCTSINGDVEKGINLNILLALRDMLRVSGYEVEVTRDTERVSLRDIVF